MKTLEVKTSMLLNLVFVDNTIVSRFFLFFFFIDLKHLIAAVIAQFFNPIANTYRNTN